MVLSCASIASQRLRDRGVGRKIAGIDTALEFGKRDHRHYFLDGDRTAFTDRVGIGQALGATAAHAARPEIDAISPLPHALRLIHAAPQGDQRGHQHLSTTI